MPIKLVVINEPKGGDASLMTLELPDSGGVIGRNNACDLVLHDPSRFVSSRHVELRVERGALMVTDTSSNGTYINDMSNPVGRGNTAAISSGDVLGIGDFEIRVFHEGSASASESEDTGAHAMRVLESMTDAGGPSPAPPELVSAALPEARLPEPPPAPAKPAARRAAPPPGAAGDFLRGLADGVGLPMETLQEVDPYEFGEQLGQAIRECIDTIMMVLKSRTEARNEFHLGETQMMPSRNNPLKFSTDASEVFSRFFGRYREGFLGAIEAIQQAQDDIQNHETATLFGTSVALVELISRFDPEQIAAELDESGKGKGIFHSRDARLWRAYAERYAEVTGTEFELVHREFADRFARAYKERMKELQG